VLIAHLPAGYLLTRRFRGERCLLLLGMAASVLPDLDLLWFYGPGGRHHGHHSYPSHLPFDWALLGAGLFAATFLLRQEQRPPARLALAVLLTNVFGHLALDTVAGGIEWLYPCSRTSLVLVEVPSAHSWWVANYVLHWSFLFELALLAAAGIALAYDLRPRPANVEA